MSVSPVNDVEPVFCRLEGQRWRGSARLPRERARSLRDNRNLLPEQLHKAEREPLFGICDAALGAVIHAIKPRAVVGIGRFAHARAQALAGYNVPTAHLLHPSPANPAAHQG